MAHYGAELTELERQQNEDAQQPPQSTDGATAAADQNLQSNEVSQSDNMLKAAEGSSQSVGQGDSSQCVRMINSCR